MRIVRWLSFACVVTLIATTSVLIAQDTQSASASSPTTRLMPVSGTLTDAAGTPLAGTQMVRFALFDEAEGGTLLWNETQTVTADDRGRYVAYLGAAAALPLDIFRSEQARWLAVSVAGHDLPRVMLVAVPYALKAADAETVGGKPASAFVRAGEPTAGAKGTISTASSAIDPLVTAGTPGRLAVFTTATDLGDSVVFQAGTNIGVGTGAPAAPFHLAASETPGAFFDVYSDALGALPLVSRAARGTVFAPLPVQTNDILGGLAVRGYAPSGFTGGKGQVMFRAAENWTDTANGTYLQFTTTPIGSTAFAERMRIHPDGKVNIGTTDVWPLTYQLDVFSSTGNALWGRTSASGYYAVVGDAANIGGGGNGVIGQSGSGIGVTANSNTGTALSASSGGEVIATFSGVGKVGIGTFSPFDKLDVRGDIRVGTGSTGCVKDGDGSVIAGVCASDRRFKQGVTPFARSLETVARLEPVYFTWRAEQFPDRHFGSTRSFGLIAQEVEAVLPDLVTTDAQGYKAVKYNQLPFYMLQAIRDLKAENDALKSETDLLKQQLQMQDERLRQLEQALRR